MDTERTEAERLAYLQEHAPEWLAAYPERRRRELEQEDKMAKHEAKMKQHRADMAELNRREMLLETNYELDELKAGLNAAIQAITMAASSIEAIAAVILKIQEPKATVAVRDTEGNIVQTITYPVPRDE